MLKIFKSLFKKNKKEADINLNTENDNVEASIIENEKEIKESEKEAKESVEVAEIKEVAIEEKSLTENEILFLKEIDGKKVNSRLSKKTEEIVSDAYELRKILYNEGYLRIPTEYERMESLTVAELKDILKQNSLKVSGKKSELIQRITENLSEKELDKILKGKIYTLTDKGLEAVNQLSI